MQMTGAMPTAATAPRNLRRKSAVVIGLTSEIGLHVAEAGAKAAIPAILSLAFMGTLCDIAYAQADITMSKEILAVEVRKQGFVCTNPIDAVRDVQHSRPGDTMWLLSCEVGDYRVSLVPKMAAEVRRVK